MNRKRLLFLALGLAVGIALILLWMSIVDLDDLLLKMKSVKPDLVLWASLAYLGAYFIRSWRWNLLLRNQVKVSVYRTWLYSMGGNWINYLIPIRLGEIAKAWFVKRNHGSAILNVLPSIFIDKFFDTLGIFFVLIMIPLVGLKLTLGLTVLLGLLVVVFVVFFTLLILSTKRKQGVVTILQCLFGWLPKRLRDRVYAYIMIFVQGLNVLEHSWLRLISSLILTAVGICLDGLYFYLLFLAFGIDAYSFWVVLFGYTLINLSYALPQPPAQLGSNEWMMIIIFSLGFALTRQDASAIMAFAHMLTALLMGVTGMLAISLSGHKVLHAIINGEKINE